MNDISFTKKQNDADQSMMLNDSIIEEEKQIVEVEYISSIEQAKESAKAWLHKNPGYEWRGQWKGIVAGKVSVMEMYKVPIVDMENLSQFQVTLL